MTLGRLAIAMFLCSALGAGAAVAQTNAEVNAGIQFNFSTPGARSLGLGGAFIGLADDATAAFTNPAGLTVLSRPEVSLEGRSWSYTHEIPVRGHDFGAPTQEGVDRIAGVQREEFDDDASGLSFASFVYPRGRWAVAVYRHQLARFEANLETEGLFQGTPPDISRFFPILATMDLDIVNYGISGAFRVVEGLSLGVGAAYYDFEIDSVTRRFSVLGPDDEAPGGFFGAPDYSPDNLWTFQDQRGEDEDVALIGGLLWEIGPRWSLGAVYREGPEFEFVGRNVVGPALIDLAPPGELPPNGIFAEQTGTFKVPDVYGIGVAFQPTDSLTVTLDYDHVKYSDLTEDVLNIFTEPQDSTPEFDAAVDRLEIDDADEVHLGVEYVFFGAPIPLAIRVGTYYDPDHRMAFQGAPTTDDDRTFAVLFTEGDDEFHYSAGLGVVLGKFQVDAAADFSDLLETFSLSGVYRFGG